MYEIRDKKGIIYNTVENPAAVFDTNSGAMLKIGEQETMMNYFLMTNEKYVTNGSQDMADDLMYMELPRSQREIDKVFQITGYIKKLYIKTLPIKN